MVIKLSNPADRKFHRLEARRTPPQTRTRNRRTIPTTADHAQSVAEEEPVLECMAQRSERSCRTCPGNGHRPCKASGGYGGDEGYA